jgi:outer membrane biosynthesis protein TonB
MVVWSTLAHAGALGLVLASPGDSDYAPPRVISVELVAASPAAPARAAPAAPAAPAAKPAPPKPPPPPKPKQIVLPEKSQTPKPKSEPERKPREREVFKEPETKEEKSLEELLAEMRGDADAPPAPTGSDEPVETAVAPSPGATSGTGDPLSAEERDWHARVIRKMKGIWVVPPGFRTQPLETHVMVSLDAAGNILGSPRITRRSGNPWYDESVLRGLTKASPLPPPPEAGDWPMVFEPTDSL